MSKPEKREIGSTVGKGSSLLETFYASLSGLAFGLVSPLASQPFDTLKTKMQADPRCARQSVSLVAQQVLRENGLRGLYSGIMPILASTGAQKSVLFAANAAGRRACEQSGIAPLTAPIPLSGGLKPAVIVGGVASAAARTLIETPFELAKVRAQTGGSFRVIASGGGRGGLFSLGQLAEVRTTDAPTTRTKHATVESRGGGARERTGGRGSCGRGRGRPSRVVGGGGRTLVVIDRRGQRPEIALPRVRARRGGARRAASDPRAPVVVALPPRRSSARRPQLYTGAGATWGRATVMLVSFFALCDYSERAAPALMGQPLLGGFLKGGVCATAAWAVAWPLEVAKSKIQGASAAAAGAAAAGAASGGARRGTVVVLREIVRADGLRGLYRGFLPGAVRSFVANGAGMAVYQLAQSLRTD